MAGNPTLADRPAPLEPVRVMCAADAAYAAALCVKLVSLVTHLAKERRIEIYVMGSEIPDADRRKIEVALQSARPGFELSSLHWLSPDRSILQGLPVSEHINLETYSRLLTPLVLPEDCERVLFLDCDMVVLSDVSPLYDIPEYDCALHATRDYEVGTVDSHMGVFNYAELGIPPKTPYFNCGVLVMNLRHWREKKIAERVLRYLRDHKDEVRYHDQGAMNAILHDSWKEVDPSWNQTRAILWPDQWQNLGGSVALWRRVKNRPKIVHFTGPDKPWIPRMRRPGYTFFYRYLKKTPYRNDFKSLLLEHLIGFRLHLFIWIASRNRYPLFKDRWK